MVNPVISPPGREKLSTNPALTGSETPTNTIGIVRVCCLRAATTGVVSPTMRSGVRATSSFANARMRSGSPPAQRYSIRRLRPSNQPSSCRPNSSASDVRLRELIVRRADQDAHPLYAPRLLRAHASDQLAAAPPNSVKSSRRLKLSECMCAGPRPHHILPQRAHADKRYFSIERHLPSHCLKLR